MIYGSVCSGIEAATVAWHGLGWRPAFFSEIEAFPRAVLKHYYPDVPLHGDFTTIGVDDYEPIELLVGGTPCQDFSVAGLRAGLDGERGNLTLEFIRLAGRLRPRWLVWENVPGVLSLDRGRAFGSVLGALAELGYGFAYRVLDAQYFGVPQRRRRVFVVGYLGDWRRAAAVLFEPESLRGDPPPSRKAGHAVGTLTANGVGTCGADDNQGQAGHLIAHTLRGEGFDASEDVTGRGTPLVPVCFSSKDNGRDATNDLAPTLRSMGHDASHPNGGGQLAVALSIRGREGGATAEIAGEVATALRASQGGGDKAHVLVASIHENQRGELRLSDTTGAITCAGGKPGQGYPAAMVDMAVRRLTPRECERLQGFPDDYTKIPYRNKSAENCPDGPRYKALGNSMAVPVMRWIGKRIQYVNKITGD